jgi:hypothetical protein
MSSSDGSNSEDLTPTPVERAALVAAELEQLGEAIENPGRPSDVYAMSVRLHASVGRIANVLTKVGDWLELNRDLLYADHRGDDADASDLALEAAESVRRFAAELSRARREFGDELPGQLSQFGWRGHPALPESERSPAEPGQA